VETDNDIHRSEKTQRKRTFPEREWCSHFSCFPQEFYALQSEKFVDETFHGSLPAFFSAFTARKDLTAEEIAQIRELIDSYEER
jgi:hypothetical protein